MARIGLATLVSLWCRRAAGESFNLQADSLHDRVTSLSQPSLSDLHFISPSYAEPPLDGDPEAVELLDTVLVASVDGRFHAIDRTTGKLRWSMSSADESQMQSVPGLGPLVRSRSPIVDREDWDPDWDTYVIEPQSGDIFVVPSHAGPTEPLHKLGISVDTLVEHSPFSIYGDKPRTFIGKKETSLLSIDLRTGRIASFVNVAEECKWDDEPSPGDAGSTLASWHDSDDDRDDRTRGRSPTVSIGRTDYYVTVYAGGKKIQHLSYSRYGPNNIDNSLQSRWTETPDALYMQSHPRGHLWAFSTNQSEVDWLLPHFEHPIVSIFDVVTVKGRADPVALLQPRPRIGDLIDINKNQADAIYAQLADRTYVGKIANALYAMSAKNFPLVAFDMQDRQARPANDEGEPDSGYHIGGWHEECTKPECMVGRWRTHDARGDPRSGRWIDGPKSDVGISKTIEIATASMVTSTATSTRITDPSNSSVSADLPALWSSPKAYGPAAAFMVAIFLWVVIQKTSSILPHRHRSTAVAEHKQAPVNETTARSPDMTPVPPTPVAAPVDMSARPVTPIPPLDPPVVLTVATSSEVEVPDPISDSGAQGGDDGSDGEDDDKDDAATPGKRRRRRKRVRKPKNKVASADQAGLSDSKDDGKEDSFVLVEGEAPAVENIVPNVQLVLPTPASPASAARVSPASLVVSETVLGFGSHGTIVYQGAFQGRAVAVKRLLGDFTTLATREVELLQESDDHPNVIRYFFKEHRDNFLYIALELCPASLADIVERPDVFRDISIEFDPKRALNQITAGIRHLHSLKIIHRDIKPQNILISHTKNGARRMLISDFGLCKKLDHDQTSFLPTMHGAMAAGTVGWRAPEILRGDVALDPMMASDDSSQQSRGSNASGYSPIAGTATTAKRLTKSVDVFALGCLFYYTLTNGDHPYGDRFERESNILKNEFRLTELERLGEEGVEAMDLIAMMLDPEPKSRPDTLSVLLHPFFWTPGRRLAFLQDASDRFEIMCRDPRDESLVELETGAHGVVGNDWHARLDRIFIENLGKFRKYDGRTVQDLLRALRNKKHHYQDMPDNVKRHLGPLPEGFLAYFTRRFPALFMHVHAVISRTGLNTEPMFRSYFELAES